MPKFNCAFHQISGVLKIKIKIVMLFRPCLAQYKGAFNIFSQHRAIERNFKLQN